MNSCSVHTTRVISVFDVWAVYDRNWRKPHYPSYMVRQEKVGSALDLEGAERIVRETVRFQAEAAFGGDRLHSLRIVEIPLGGYAPEWQTLSEYVYDHEGDRLDCRTIPCEDGVFSGRAPGEIRFREGDLCEVLEEGRVVLGCITGLPPSVERCAKVNGTGAAMDSSDDCYYVLTSQDAYTEPTDALRVFKPRYKIALRTERRILQAYNDYRTFRVRMAIADAAAGARLMGAAEELGWVVRRIETPRWKDDTFKLMLDGVPGFPNGLDLQVMQKTAWQHMGRILVSFRRLAGLPAEGRGYRLKRIVPPPPLVKGIPVPEDPMYRL